MKTINTWHLQSFFHLNIPIELNQLYVQIDYELSAGEVEQAAESHTNKGLLSILTGSFLSALSNWGNASQMVFEIMNMEDNSKKLLNSRAKGFAK